MCFQHKGKQADKKRFSWDHPVMQDLLPMIASHLSFASQARLRLTNRLARKYVLPRPMHLRPDIASILQFPDCPHKYQVDSDITRDPLAYLDVHAAEISKRREDGSYDTMWKSVYSLTHIGCKQSAQKMTRFLQEYCNRFGVPATEKWIQKHYAFRQICFSPECLQQMWENTIEHFTPYLDPMYDIGT